MASKEDTGAKTQVFYDIECVIDDCDADGGYKPLSDSDELDESAEEDELDDEGVDASEEWEPLMRRSKAKKQQHGSLSASVPRRRGRPRKHPPQPMSIAAGRSLPVRALYSSANPRGRGRPPNNKPRIPLMPKPTLYPTIIPNAIPLLNSLPILTINPNSTSFLNNIQSNSSAIHTPNSALVTFSHDSTHASLPNAVPNITFASNHTSDPTDQFSPNSITTLICVPNQTGLLLNTDTGDISASMTEKEALDEKVDFGKECVTSPERSTSPMPIAKRQRLSSPSPPAITPVRRRGRPRKHPPKIIPNSTDPGTNSNLTNESANTSNLTNESSNRSNLTNEFSNTSNLTNESSNTSNLTNESLNTSNFTKESSTNSNLTNESSNTLNLTNESATVSIPENVSSNASNVTNETANTSKPTDEHANALNPTNEPANPLNLKNEPSSSLDLQNEPANTSDLKNEPANTSNFKNEPLSSLDLQNEPANTSNLKNEPLSSLDLQNEPANTSNFKNEPLSSLDLQNEPANASNLKNETLSSLDLQNEPANTSNLKNEPSRSLDLQNEPANTSDLKNEPANTSNLKNKPLSSLDLQNEPANTSNLKNEPSRSLDLQNEPANTSNLKNEPSSSLDLPNEPANTSNLKIEPATTSNHPNEPPVAVPDSTHTPAGSLADCGLDENRKSAGIIDSDEEDLWEDCVECADGWKPPIKKNPERLSTTQSIKLFENISECTSWQPSDLSPESPLPNPTMGSSDHPPVPTSQRRGRPSKRKKPIYISVSTPIVHPPSDPKHTPNPNTSAPDLSRVKSENSTDSDQWHDVTVKDEEPVLPDFCPKRPPGPQIADAPHSPLQLFQLFFSTSVMQTIVRNTNGYAEQKAEAEKKTSCWVPLTVKEFCSFLALVLYMGLVKVDTLMDYWARKSIYSFPYPRSVMSRDRFQAIFSNLYLCDPRDDMENNRKRASAGYDRLMKIKPLYTDMVSACRTHFHPNREISVDERTRIGLKRHAIAMGYKLFVLFDSSSGYNWNFFVYEGKSSTSGKGVGYDAVMRLLDVEVLGKGYRLFTDTFYTSPTLFGDLLRSDVVSCGLLRHTSGLLEENVSNRKADRGSIRWCRRGALLFVKWTNVSEIVTCSTMHKAFAGDFISRSVRGAGGEQTLHQIPIPPAVKDCNKFTGGEDSTDALFGYDNILYKTKKWYKTFFFHFLEIAVVNSYVLHRHVAKGQYDRPLSQKAFREELISELEHVGKTFELSSPIQAAQCLPEYFGSDVPARRTFCAMCRLSGNDVAAPVFCSRCRVPLCCVASRNCFKTWHLQGHLDL